MKLSILDQSPISSGKTAKEALETSIKLAKLGETIGYKRYWIAEHHDLFGLACPNPGIMLSTIGAHTNTIRLGAGAVLLPYYKPFRVAETYNLLATLFPNRIDLGLGRAPGGSAEVSLALVDNYLAQVRKYPEQVHELLNYIYNTDEEASTNFKISPTPIPNNPPHVWMLGTSERSAHLAAKDGMPYAFGHFMSHDNGISIVNDYREQFRMNDQQPEPEVIIALSVICAETNEKAEQIAQSYLLWQLRQDQPTTDRAIPSLSEVESYYFTTEEQEKIQKLKKQMIIGDPQTVKAKLLDIQQQYDADELMIVTITHDEIDKFNSYKLIMDQFSDK